MDPMRNEDRGPRRPGLASTVRRLLLVRLPPDGIRPVDMIALPIGVIVAFFVCIPIWTVTMLVAAVVASNLERLGVGDDLGRGVMVLGIVIGLALSAIVLRRIWRRVPSAIRAFAFEEEAGAPREAASIIQRDPRADTDTVADRLAAADATLVTDRRGSGADGPASPVTNRTDAPGPRTPPA